MTNDAYNQGSAAFKNWRGSLRINVQTGNFGIGSPSSPPENPFPQGSKHYEEWEIGFSDAEEYFIHGQYEDGDDE